MSKQRTRVWAEIDAGKAHHWAAVVDDTGATLWSRKIANDETAILDALADILGLAQEVSWAIDIAGTSSALLPRTASTRSTCLAAPSTGCPAPTGARPKPMPATPT